MTRQSLRRLYCTIDLRSLALFRWLLGGVLILDWCSRWPNLEAFYTSFGLWPADASLPKWGGVFHFSLLDGITSLPLVRAAFLLGLLCYIGFLVGYRTRLCHLLSVVFLVSVLNRTPIVRDGSDMVLVTMAVWSLFLPLGQYCSLDAARAALRRGVDLHRPRAAAPDADSQRCEPSLAAFAIVAQLALIYFLTAFVKDGFSWRDGTAVYYMWQADQFVRPLGRWLVEQPLWFIQGVTWGALGLEYAAAPLILLPWGQPWLRRTAILLLTTMHVGVAATMAITHFSLLMISTYALLLLPEDWAWLVRLARRRSRAVTVYYDDTCGFCTRWAQWVAIADRGRRIRWIGNTNRAAFQHQIGQEELEASLVVFDDASQRKTTQVLALAAIAQALPLPWSLLRCLAWPGINLLTNAGYRVVARHRHRLSAWLGLQACGVESIATSGSAIEAERTTPLTVVQQRLGGLLATLAATILGVAVLLSSYNLNIATRLQTPTVHEPAWLRAVIQGPQLVHDWHLFAPYPFTDDGWWVIDGVTVSGASFDPLTGQPTTWEKPPHLADRYDRFWMKYLYRLWLTEFQEYRLYFGRYLTRQNHRAQPPGRRLVRFKLYYVLETTPPPGSPAPFPTERILLWEHECFAKP